MKTITIPKRFGYPTADITINGIEHTFNTGVEIEVDDHLAEIIENAMALAPKESETPSTGGGGERKFELVGTIDFSTAEMARGGAYVEYAVEGVSEILAVWTDMVNASASKSTINLYADGELVKGISIARTGSSGTPLNGYTKVTVYEGVGAIVNVSQGAISATNYGTATDDSTYNLFPITTKITKIRVTNPPTQYYAVGGILKIYAR